MHVANQVTLPAYLQILHSMRTRLASGDWRVGDQIPTDEELMAHFGVSRFTVRAALDVLVADGIVKRYRRRGSFVVARPEGAGTWMLTSLDDLVLSSFPTAPIVLDAAECRCDAQIAGAEAGVEIEEHDQNGDGGGPHRHGRCSRHVSPNRKTQP